jgi:EmrB/QacA subfamily drug resistance transporter
MHRYLVFASVGLSLLMYAIDSTVVSVAFPSITRDLHSTVLWSAWTISIYFIAVTVTVPLAGRLGDSLGRKKIFLISLLLFTGSSLACGLAPSIGALIVFRFIQGVGGACFVPTASGIVADEFPKSREAAIGLFSSIFTIGAIIGPNLGGWVVSRYSWRSIFYINVPIGAILLVAGMMLLKDVPTLSRPRIDFAGFALLCGSLLLLMVGLSLAGGGISPRSILLAGSFISASLIFGAFFFRQERRAPQPVLDPALLQSRPFVAANVANLAIGMTMMGVFSFVPLYVTSVLGLSTLMSGMILTPGSVAMTISSTVTAFLLRRWGYRWPMVIGFTGVAFMTMLLAPGPLSLIMGDGWGSIRSLVLLLFVNGIVGGMVFPAANNACIELMPEKVGTIVGLRNMFRNIGGALGISIITLILHLSHTPRAGFTIVFIAFGLIFVVSIPFLFFMPAGRRGWTGRSV